MPGKKAARKPPKRPSLVGSVHTYFLALRNRGWCSVMVADSPDTFLPVIQRGSPWKIEVMGCWKVHRALARSIAGGVRSIYLRPTSKCEDEWFQCNQNDFLWACRATVMEYLTGEEMSQPADPRTRAILTTAGVFNTATEAAAHFGISRQAAHMRAVKGTRGWRFA